MIEDILRMHEVMNGEREPEIYTEDGNIRTFDLIFAVRKAIEEQDKLIKNLEGCL
ncbi:hypothetical protein [Priestia megaterium]|uniref:hypothetical protein n=1 Tax=Priestia megaterium TaxID=1404 RepID=UPI0028773EF1|nr:hypothetical protein [Priestia megaterium]